LLSYKTESFKVSVYSDEQIFLIHQALGIRYFFSYPTEYFGKTHNMHATTIKDKILF